MIYLAWTASCIFSPPMRAHAQRASDAWVRLETALPEQDLCPEWRQLNERISSLVAGEPDGEPQFVVWLRARRDDASMLEATVRNVHAPRDESRERVLRDHMCATLTEAVAVVLALVINPEETRAALAREQSHAAPTNESDTETPAAASDTSENLAHTEYRAPAIAPTERADSAQNHRDIRWQFALGGAAIAHTHLLPNASGGGSLHLGVSADMLRAQLGALWLTPNTQRTTRGAGAELAAWAAFLAIGYGFALNESWTFTPSARAELGEIYGHGIGVAPSRHGKGLWVGAAIETEVEWRLHPWFAVFCAVSARIVPLRPTFYLDGIGEIFRAPLLDASGTLGVRFFLGDSAPNFTQQPSPAS